MNFGCRKNSYRWNRQLHTINYLKRDWNYLKSKHWGQIFKAFLGAMPEFLFLAMCWKCSLTLVSRLLFWIYDTHMKLSERPTPLQKLFRLFFSCKNFPHNTQNIGLYHGMNRQRGSNFRRSKHNRRVLHFTSN